MALAVLLDQGRAVEADRVLQEEVLAALLHELLVEAHQ